LFITQEDNNQFCIHKYSCANFIYIYSQTDNNNSTEEFEKGKTK